MGEDWAEVVGEDAVRFAANHELSPVPTPDRVEEGSHGEMRWIQNNDELKNSEWIHPYFVIHGFLPLPVSHSPLLLSRTHHSPSPPLPPFWCFSFVDYPALSELITNLHALPHELNAKAPSKLKLCAAQPVSLAGDLHNALIL